MTEESSGRRLNLGMHRLEEWAASATQVEKNVVYDALFAVLNGTVFSNYRILNDLERTREFFVIVRDNLVVKIRFCDSEEFGIEYIGEPIAPPERNVDAYYEA